MRRSPQRSRVWHRLKKYEREKPLSHTGAHARQGNQDTVWIEGNQLFETFDQLIRLSLRESTLDQVDGIERTVDRAMSAEEEAGQRHHLAAPVGRERRDDQGHGQVQESPEPPTPGDEK